MAKEFFPARIRWYFATEWTIFVPLTLAPQMMCSNRCLWFWWKKDAGPWIVSVFGIFKAHLNWSEYRYNPANAGIAKLFPTQQQLNRVPKSRCSTSSSQSMCKISSGSLGFMFLYIWGCSDGFSNKLVIVVLLMAVVMTSRDLFWRWAARTRRWMGKSHSKHHNLRIQESRAEGRTTRPHPADY